MVEGWLASWLAAVGLSGQSQDGDGAVGVGTSASSVSEGRDLVVAEKVGAWGARALQELGLLTLGI